MKTETKNQRKRKQSYNVKKKKQRMVTKENKMQNKNASV